jgi:hypothetical protein
MQITIACPTCHRSQHIPERLNGGRVKCVQCGKFFTASATLGPTAPAAGFWARVTPIKVATWIGMVALAAGATSTVVGMFPGTAGFCRVFGWMGLLLGGGTVGLALYKDEYTFTFPFAGLATSVLALALVAFFPGEASSRRGRGDFRAGMGNGPPQGWKGGQGGGKGGPFGRKGRAPGDKGKAEPPPGAAPAPPN